jgi:hypothetical protein
VGSIKTMKEISGYKLLCTMPKESGEIISIESINLAESFNSLLKIKCANGTYYLEEGSLYKEQ